MEAYGVAKAGYKSIGAWSGALLRGRRGDALETEVAALFGTLGGPSEDGADARLRRRRLPGRPVPGVARTPSPEGPLTATGSSGSSTKTSAIRVASSRARWTRIRSRRRRLDKPPLGAPGTILAPRVPALASPPSSRATSLRSSSPAASRPTCTRCSKRFRSASSRSATTGSKRAGRCTSARSSPATRRS